MARLALGFDTGVLFMAGAAGVALARPLLDLAGDVAHELRRLVHRRDEGVFYAYRGRRIVVHEDVERSRWIRVADLREIAPLDAATLRRLESTGHVRRLGRMHVPHVAAERLLDRVRADGDGDPRFATWLARTVVLPSRQARERAHRMRTGVD